MKQIEIDNDVAVWRRAVEASKECKRALNKAECDEKNAHDRLARKLIGDSSNPNMAYVFPTTDGGMVRAFLDKQERHSEGGGTATVRVPKVVEHEA